MNVWCLSLRVKTPRGDVDRHSKLEAPANRALDYGQEDRYSMARRMTPQHAALPPFGSFDDELKF